jgi:acyl-CoA synthetase (AMP-forming)/AMP-acid ligase II
VGLTAAELRERVRTVRGALGDVAGRGVIVACERPLVALVAVLATLEAGGVACPANLRLPAAAREAHAAAVRPAATLGDDGVHRHDGARPFDPRVALVLATSGSTGAIRHVQLGRDGLLANVDAILSYLPLRAHRRPAITLPLWYSYALVGQAFAALRAGASPVLLGDEPFPVRQAEAMAAHAVDGVSSVPGALAVLAEAVLDLPDASRPRPAWVASAGEPLPAGTVARLRRAFPTARLFNQYGLTEASPRVAAIGDDDPGFDLGAVGHPLPGLTVFAEHPDGRPATSEDPAEIRVRGPSVMLGYLDAPDATARALDGGLWTGDLGWVDAEGRLYVVARTDDVVKISGERVSLEGVRRVLAGHPATAEAVVLAVPGGERGTRLVAFARTADPDGLQRWARDHLPTVARPQRWFFVDDLPRTPHGKVDRARLRAVLEGGA